jgi:hypothetical protein
MYRNAFKNFSSSFRHKFTLGVKKLFRHDKILGLAMASFAAYHSKKYFMIDESETKTLRQHIK